MLIEFDRICRKEDIKYSIESGTLLGAVRNNKFIPWDYDVDVSMTRDEYNKFFLACGKYLDKSRFFWIVMKRIQNIFLGIVSLGG